MKVVELYAKLLSLPKDDAVHIEGLDGYTSELGNIFVRRDELHLMYYNTLVGVHFKKSSVDILRKTIKNLIMNGDIKKDSRVQIASYGADWIYLSEVEVNHNYICLK